MKHEAVLFDLDGTLIDSFDGIVGLFLESMEGLGMGGVSEAAVRDIIGLPLDACFARFLPQDRVDHAVQFYRTRYVDRMHDISPSFPGAEGLLSELKAAGIQLGIVSNKRAGPLREIVGRKGWPVDIVLGEGEGIPAKPAPDLLWAACDRLGVDRRHVLFVGDSHLDAVAAEAAGLSFAALTTGEMAEADFSRWAKVGVFPSLMELREFLLG